MRPVGAEFFLEDGRADRQAWRSW